MQVPSVERSVNWPPAAAGSRSGAGAAATPESTPVTAAIQEETAKVVAVSQPESSVKVDISTTQQEIARLEAAAQARAIVRVTPQGEAEQVKAVGGIENTRPLVETAATAKAVGAVESDSKPTNGLEDESPETAAKAAKLLAAGKEPGPDQPLAAEESPSTDWTTTPKAVEKKPETPPPEPISKKLLDFLQQLWRAGGNAIDVVQVTNQTLNPEKLPDGPLTYEDPSAPKRTTGV